MSSGSDSFLVFCSLMLMFSGSVLNRGYKCIFTERKGLVHARMKILPSVTSRVNRKTLFHGTMKEIIVIFTGFSGDVLNVQPQSARNHVPDRKHLAEVWRPISAT